MTDEQQKDLEAANFMRDRLGSPYCYSPVDLAYLRAISALEDRAKAPSMRQISRQEVFSFVSRAIKRNSTENHWACDFINLLHINNLLAEPASEPHPLDALKFTHAPLVNWNQVADKINALIDYLKQQEDKQP